MDEKYRHPARLVDAPVAEETEAQLRARIAELEEEVELLTAQLEDTPEERRLQAYNDTGRRTNAKLDTFMARWGWRGNDGGA